MGNVTGAVQVMAHAIINQAAELPRVQAVRNAQVIRSVLVVHAQLLIHLYVPPIASALNASDARLERVLISQDVIYKQTQEERLEIREDLQDVLGTASVGVMNVALEGCVSLSLLPRQILVIPLQPTAAWIVTAGLENIAFRM